MKRLLCIIDSLDAGGAETFLMKVYRALPPEEYQFDFIVSADSGCYTGEVMARGGRIHVIPMRRKNPFGAFRGICSAVKENGCEAVLKLGSSPVAAVDLIAAKLGGAKCVAMRSCNALTGQSWKKKAVDALLRPVLNAVADVKIAPSMLAAEFTFGEKIAHKDVCLLHNGVDLDVFRFDPQGRCRIRDAFGLADKLVVGHVGRFHGQKNHRYLLEVFQQIRKRRADAVLMLVGTGEKETEIRGWVKEMDLENSVIFTGVRFDIPHILSAMDVFVFPSLHEGMPNTVIEAQATGLPCVIADTITDEADITGLVKYLPLSEKPETWAALALSMISDARKDTRADFIAQGYDIESVAKTLIELFFPGAKTEKPQEEEKCVNVD